LGHRRRTDGARAGSASPPIASQLARCSNWQSAPYERVVRESSLRLNDDGRGARALGLCDGRIARAPRLAVVKNVLKSNLHQPRSTFADCASSFDANDFNLSPTIARIIVIQNLSRLEHGSITERTDAPSILLRVTYAGLSDHPTIQPSCQDKYTNSRTARW
jgi:hypothetical protein